VSLVLLGILTASETGSRYVPCNNYKALLPAADIEKMRAAGPVKTSYPLLSSPELEQVRRLKKVARTPLVEIKSASMNLSLRRHSPDARLHERQCPD
jgi:hypothetical protein